MSSRRWYSKRHYAMINGYPGSAGNPDYRTPEERKADERKATEQLLARARAQGLAETVAILESILVNTYGG